MPDIVMTPGSHMLLKVTDRKENTKSWGSATNRQYRHDISLLDTKTGNTSLKEFVSNCPTIPLGMFPVGVQQYIKCITVTKDKNDTIEPYDPEGESRQVPLVAGSKSALPGGTAEDNNHLPKPFTPKADISKMVSVGFSYAKDLKVAEIANRETNSIVTQSDIDDVIAWAGKINTGIIDQINF